MTDSIEKVVAEMRATGNTIGPGRVRQALGDWANRLAALRVGPEHVVRSRQGAEHSLQPSARPSHLQVLPKGSRGTKMTADTITRVDVERFDDGGDLGMQPYGTNEWGSGDYVRHSDYAALLLLADEMERHRDAYKAADESMQETHSNTLAKLAERDAELAMERRHYAQAREDYAALSAEFRRQIEAAEIARDESDNRANELRVAVGSYLNWYRRGDKKDALEKYGSLSNAHDAFLAANGGGS